ncbi:signal transduction histidine kinase [Asaia krungthepensis NRIC 0535]|uniref:Signal transduction histidine kinase n=2 Tax=Asaia krungthepensis TaxID=220990 RepID=A0ABQ0Q6D8_9PROT|nr:signal transduction histidine kinase [Asaia krungthepensis NRIC 0535]
MPWLAHGATFTAVIAFIIGSAVFITLPLLPGRLAPPIEWRVIIYALIGIVLIPFGGYWGVFFISAAATCGAIDNRRRAVALLALVLAVCILLALTLDHNVIGCLITLIVAAGTFTTMSLSMDLHRQNQALGRAQDEIRALTLIAERERFARDLHDTLGQSLTVIALKSELGRRHLPHAPENAVRELEEIGDRARQALAETRLAVSAMRVTSLEQELASGVEALRDAGLEVAVSGETRLMPAVHDAVLALIIREGLTNILRHANADRCIIRFLRLATGEAQLEIADQSASTAHGGIPLSFREGNGIKGMRARLAQVDGTLLINRHPEGTSLVITLGEAS